MRAKHKEGFGIIKRRSGAAVAGVVLILAALLLFLLTPAAYAADMICSDCHVSQHSGTPCPDCTTCHTGIAQGVNHHTGAGHTIGSSTCVQCHTTVHPGPVVPGPCSTCHAVEATAPLNHRPVMGIPASCAECHTEPGVRPLPNNLNVTCWQCHGGGTNSTDNPPRYPILWLSDATLAARANGIHWIRPDMVISDLLIVPSATNPGAAISITDSTKNRGGGPAVASTTDFYLSADTTLEGGDVFLGSRAVPALAYNETSTGTTSVTIPGATATGAYYIIAKADSADAVVGELSETNNTRVSDALSIARSDLVILSFYAPNSAKKGASISMTDVTKNRLTDTAGASTTSVYLSANTTWDAGDVLLGSRAVPALAGGASSAATYSVTIPAGTTAGTYYVIWKADSAGVVGEQDETNNTKYKAITITN